MASPQERHYNVSHAKHIFPAVRSRPARSRRRRFRAIPVRTLLPNLITLLALCAGLTAIRLAAEGRFDWALAGVVFAAMLDGIDGRLARLLKGTSRFGAELDSLADFVNFGVAPALILYFWDLHNIKSAGWIAALVFAICARAAAGALQRHARRSQPAGMGVEFFHRHAGAGRRDRRACCRSMCNFLAFRGSAFRPRSIFIYTLAIAFLMVSRLPVYSGKKLGTGVAPHMVLAGVRRRGCVLCTAAELPVGSIDHRHVDVSREPAVQLDVLSGTPASRCGRGSRPAETASSAAASGEAGCNDAEIPKQPPDANDRPARLN